MENLKARIEAVLFTTAKALSTSEIAEILEVENEQVEEAILDLIMDYSARDGRLKLTMKTVIFFKSKKNIWI